MKPLSALDALFLHLETPATPMHVGAVHLLGPPPGGGDFLARVRRHVAGRLHLSPVFTRRLATMPLRLANPVWVDAGEVDVERHVVRVRLPAPGSIAQLEAAVARLHAQPLDRAHPLWRFHLIEGCGGNGYAFYSKVHHAALDGAAGVAFAHALLDPTPAPRGVAPAGTRARDVPGTAALLGTALATSGTQAADLVRRLPALARGAASLLKRSSGLTRRAAFGPRTAFNGTIDAGRRFATASLPLAEVRRLAAANGTTVNDVVLVLVGGALRDYLRAHGGLPAKSLVAAVPMSLREAGDTEPTTRATMTLAPLATTIDDPLERLRAVRASTRSVKDAVREFGGALPTDLPSLGLPWLLSAAAALYGRLAVADRIPPIANLVVSNVPGPEVPLYLAGAKLVTFWPVSIVTHGLGLNITLQSYAGSLDFGILAARDGMADPRELARSLHDALARLAAVTAGDARHRGA